NPQDNAVGNIKEILSLNATATSAASAAGLTVTFTSTIINGTDPVALTITGSATKAVYQQILDGVQYADTKGGAHSDTSPRVVTVVANDGANNSTSHSVTITVAKPAGVAGEPIN